MESKLIVEKVLPAAVPLVLSRFDGSNIIRITGAPNITGAVTVALDGAETPQEGDFFHIMYEATATDGGGSLAIFSAVPNIDVAWYSKPLYISAYYRGGAWVSKVFVDAAQVGWLVTAALAGKAVTAAKLQDLPDGSVFGGNAAGNAAVLSVGGVLSAITAGAVLVFTFVAGSITNAAIAAGAAITRTKLAAGTAAHVLINNGLGDMSSEAQLAAVRGGMGIDTSASTGVPKVTAGVWTIVKNLAIFVMDVSFETGYLGANSVMLPFAGEVMGLYSYVGKLIEVTDDATITASLAGVPITDGQITITAGSINDTADSATPTALNTFAANTKFTLTGAKITAGGSAKVTVVVKLT